MFALIKEKWLEEEWNSYYEWLDSHPPDGTWTLDQKIAFVYDCLTSFSGKEITLLEGLVRSETYSIDYIVAWSYRVWKTLEEKREEI